MPPDDITQDAVSAAAAIAVLQERTNTMGREMREMKEQQQRQGDEFRASQKEMATKLDAVLTLVSEGRGAGKTLAWVGSVCVVVGGLIGWAISLYMRVMS